MRARAEVFSGNDAAYKGTMRQVIEQNDPLR